MHVPIDSARKKVTLCILLDTEDSAAGCGVATVSDKLDGLDNMYG